MSLYFQQIKILPLHSRYFHVICPELMKVRAHQASYVGSWAGSVTNESIKHQLLAQEDSMEVCKFNAKILKVLVSIRKSSNVS